MSDRITKPLEEVLEKIQTGSTPSTARPEFFGGSIPWLTPGDIGESRDLVQSVRCITDLALTQGKARLFSEKTLLVTCIGDIGRVGVLQKPASSNQQITALKFCDEVDVYYAYYWFIANRYRLEQLANQAVVPILNNERLLEVEFYYPALLKQQRIVAQLDKADRLRRLRRYTLDLGETYLQSVFLEMFGDPVRNEKKWKVLLVEEILATNRPGTQTGPFGSSLKRHEYVAEGIPVWGINNVSENEFVEDEPLFITPAKYQELERYSVESGDILISRAGTVGRMCVARPTQSPSIIGTNLVRVALDQSGMVPEYFTALFTHFGSSAGQLRMSGDENAYSFLNPTILRTLKIQVPPLALQEKFVGIVRQYDRLRAQQREALRQAEMLFGAVLEKAFAA